MKKRLLLFMFSVLTILLLSLVVMPTKNTLAAIADGTYEVNYEMKEANNDNTSIADGFFTKPAILTVEDGFQSILITVTSSNMIESLSLPSGSVEVISEDESEETRIVRFSTNQDLSLPVDIEMHVIVPDLYDTTHATRAFFDVEELKKVGSNENSSNDVLTNNSQKEDGFLDSDDNTTEKGKEINEDKDVPEKEATNESTSNGLYITLILIGILVLLVIVFLIIKNKNSNLNKRENENEKEF